MTILEQKSVGIDPDSSINFRWVFVLAVFIALILSGCSSRTVTNEYDLKKAVNSKKMPASELESIAHTLRTSVEQSHRVNTKWLYYWMNAQAVKMCGRVSLDNPRMAKADIPSEIINLQDVVMLAAQVAYQGNTEAELENNSEAPIVKIVEGKLIYKDDHWEVESFEEQPQDRLTDDCAIQIKK
jgi:hypothetical protein